MSLKENQRSNLIEDLDDDDDEQDEVQVKRLKSDLNENSQSNTDETDNSDLKEFLNYLNSENVFVNYDKVKITRRGTSHNYGMIAIKDIEKDEILSRIPKNAILDPSTTQIKDLISKNSKELKTKSNWSKLIISIMHELSIPNSKWKIYLKMFPNYDCFDLPMFWEESEKAKLLENTCIPKNVNIDLENMKNEYEKVILPFLKSNKQYFDEKYFNFDYYKKIVGFIMAYSFRDPNEDPDDSKAIGPRMVPVADILNHIAKNNAELRFEKDQLLICSTKDIKKDEEVFNTYGEHSNSDLLHMYGFVEVYPHNIFDSIEIPTSLFVEICKKQKIDPVEVVNKKIETMIEIELIDESASIIVGHDGILNEEECLHMLQIFSMPIDDFSEFLENDCELMGDEEWDSYSLLNENIYKIPIDWKSLIKDCCQAHMENLKRSLEKMGCSEYLEEKDLINKRKIKQRYESAKTLLDGQIKLLHNFLTFLDK